jgi:hypothetical protein
MTRREHLNKIRTAIENGRPGYRDESALYEIRKEVSNLRYAGLSGYCFEKSGEILRLSDIYFSPRKHHRQRGGLHQVELWLFQAIDSLRSNLPEEDSPKT